MKYPFFSILLAAFLSASASAEPAQQFCTLEQGVDKILAVADIPEEVRQKPIVRSWAEDIVSEKMQLNPGKELEITFKDIYDLRGVFDAWACDQGYKVNCVGQAIDAIGSTLLGSAPGKAVVGVGLAVSGPTGFILMGGMGVTMEALQCQPSAVNLALAAGASVAVALPWCKAPGVNQACVAAGKGMKEGALAAARKIFGDKVAIQAVKQGKHGVEVVLVDAEKGAKKALAESMAAAKPTPAASKIVSKLAPNGKKPEVNFDGGGARSALPGEGAIALNPNRMPVGTVPQQQPGGLQYSSLSGAKSLKNNAPPAPGSSPAPAIPGKASQEVLSARRAQNAQLWSSPQLRDDMRQAGVTAEQLAWMRAKEAPLGFKGKPQFQEFKRDLDAALVKSGLTDAKVGMKGTSTTFYSENPGKRLGHHWDADRLNPGDYDLNLTSDKMKTIMESAGVKLGSHGVFSTRNVSARFPELERFAKKWTEKLGRDVNVVGLSQAEARDLTEFILRQAK